MGENINRRATRLKECGDKHQKSSSNNWEIAGGEWIDFETRLIASQSSVIRKRQKSMQSY